MNLQGHSRLQPPFKNGGVNPNHGKLDQVRRSALQRRVHRRTLGESAQVEVLAVDVGNRAHAAKQCLHPGIAASLIQGAINKRAYAAIFLEVSVNESFGFRSFDSQILRKPERRQAINNSKVDDLRLPPVVGRDHQWRHAEHLRCGQRMNVIATAKRLNQQRVFRVMRQQTKLDLRVVGS